MRTGLVRSRPNARHAFTLVELLVVVSIIAILIALLIPAIGGARKSAFRTSTTALMTSVGNGVNQFRTDKGRLPGYFSQNELGDADNRTGLTAMQNALLELSGGIAPEADTSQPNVINVNVQPGKSVRVDAAAVGGPEGPGYLSIPVRARGANQGAKNGIAPAEKGRDKFWNYGPGKQDIPEVLDAWGRPLVLWMKNETAGPNPEFAQISSDSKKALFYLHSNAGIFGINANDTVHASQSVLGAALTGSNNLRIASLQGLLGNPAFPNSDPGLDDGPNSEPKSPLGDFVVHSAGPDEIFLSVSTGDGVSNGGLQGVIYKPYFEQLISAGQAGNVGRRLPPDQFDDLIQGAN